MKSALFLSRVVKLMFVVLLLSNFSALAQKTNIWIVNHAEKDRNSDGLSDTGKQRAIDLMKSLKHDDVQAIYIMPKKISSETAAPLAAHDKILPRVYTDSVHKFAETLRLNFAGKNVLVVANYDTIIPLITELGANTPFDSLDKNDHDQLFCLTIKSNGDVVCTVRYFGKKHHVNEIPQSDILENYTQGVPGH